MQRTLESSEEPKSSTSPSKKRKKYDSPIDSGFGSEDSTSDGKKGFPKKKGRKKKSSSISSTESSDGSVKSTAVTNYGQRGARAPPEIFENLSVGLKG